MAECKDLGLATDTPTWLSFKRSVLGRDIANVKLPAEHLGKLRAAIESFKDAA